MNPNLDLRDERGKCLDLPLVLLGVLLALLRCRDGTMSSIHRSIVNNQKRLCDSLGIENKRVVSRSHLPRLLGKVNLEAFEKLCLKHGGIKLSKGQKEWFAADGKELRGSIEKGEKRGGASVQIVRHSDRGTLGQAFYNGAKESERPCLKGLVCRTGVQSQRLTADALHLYPAMTEMIEQADGAFLIGLKSNQKELLGDMIDHTEAFAPKARRQTVNKGHGRLEIRNYACYDISGEYFEQRWDKSGFKSLVEVQRERNILKTNKSSKETSYYISNMDCQYADELFDAADNHWSVEVNNHFRDVSLKEDSFRTKKTEVTKMMAFARSLVLGLFRIWNPKNVIAEMHRFQDSFDELINSLKSVNFL